MQKVDVTKYNVTHIAQFMYSFETRQKGVYVIYICSLNVDFKCSAPLKLTIEMHFKM